MSDCKVSTEESKEQPVNQSDVTLITCVCGNNCVCTVEKKCSVNCNCVSGVKTCCDTKNKEMPSCCKSNEKESS
jgi:hypothetical protein